MYVSCTFSDGLAEASYRFLVRDTGIAKKWMDCLSKASQYSQIREDNLWYNFPKGKYANTSLLAQDLNKIISKLNMIHPNLINESVNLDQLQESVNRLHVHFADSHLVNSQITAESFELWNEFNNLLHAFEALQRSEDLGNAHTNASIVLTWKDNFRVELADSDYQYFTVEKKFGTIYVNYCQVGRHILELFNAQDSFVEDEHVLPLRHCSADSYFWFGPSSGAGGVKRKMVSIEEWYKSHPKLQKILGMNWGDPKLAVGWLPVADLVVDCEDSEKGILADLVKYNRIKKMEVL